MNKFTITLAALAMGVSAFAQEAPAEPNRLLITDTNGSYTGYVLDRVSDISFARLEGEAKAEIELKELVSLDEITVAITMSEDCWSYIFDVVPGTVASQLTTPLSAISYLNRTTQQRYYDGFTNATVTGMNLNANSEYALVTVGYDKYGVADGVCMVNFKTPAPEIVGDPKVTCTVDEVTLTSFTCTFTPNEDCVAYYCVAGEKGTMQQQYEMFGPMFGFSNFEQMIMSFGIERTEEDTNTWTSMAPNTEFEIYVVCLDVNENPAPCQVFEVSTASLGGDGEASVAIEIGKYELADWYGEMKPSQYITFTPNDQASCFRVGVYKAEGYDADKDAILAELCSDPFMPMAYWFFYETFTTDYQIDPGVDAVAIAAAKNGKGEWGPVTEVRFTTPAEARSTGMSGNIVSRIKAKAIRNTIKAGYAPALKAKSISLK